MKNFSIKVAFKKAWGIYKANWKKLVASTFILMVVGAVFNVIKDNTGQYGMSYLIIVAALIIVSAILKIGLTKMYLKAVDGEPLSLRELFSHSKLLLKYLGAAILYSLAVFVGFVLLIIPGIYLAIRFIFVPIIIVDEHVGIKEAFKLSTDITMGVKWKLLGFLLLFTLLNIAGAILLYVGLLVTLPVAYVALMEVYRKLEKPAHNHHREQHSNI